MSEDRCTSGQRPKVWTPEMDDMLAGMFDEKVSRSAMGRIFGVSDTTVNNRLMHIGKIERPKSSIVASEIRRPKDQAHFFPLPWYDFKAWSRGAQPGQRFIYSIGDHRSKRLTLLMLAMRRDESVVLTRDGEGRRWCEKVSTTQQEKVA